MQITSWTIRQAGSKYLQGKSFSATTNLDYEGLASGVKKGEVR